MTGCISTRNKWAPFLLVLMVSACFVLFVSGARAAEKEKVKIGLALGYAGLGDMSFNDMQYNGMIRAAKAYDITTLYRIPKESSEELMMMILDELVQEGCELIFSAGYHAWLIMPNYAEKHPDVHFVVLDNPIEGINNISSVVYAQHEGSFVVGFLAAKFSKTHQVGFIGGVDIPVIKAFLEGFKEGVEYSGIDTDLIVRYCSIMPDFSGFGAPRRAYDIATELYDEGVDVIYNVASASGLGILKAAKDKDLYAIGVDADQDFLAEGHILTSMMKRLDNSIYDLVGMYLERSLEGGKVYEYNYGNGGVSTTDMKYTKELIGEDIIQEVREIERKIASGELVITNIRIVK